MLARRDLPAEWRYTVSNILCMADITDRGGWHQERTTTYAVPTEKGRAGGPVLRRRVDTL